MKYLLSYASNPSACPGRNNLYSRELVELSVRNLLRELAEVRVSASHLPAPEQYRLPGGYGQTSRPLGQNIEMKRGDWICPKCSFMNFARNVKCLECEESRPKRQLTGGEWECPQCDFFNYGRNLVCLRCDCKRPGEASFDNFKSRPELGYSNENYTNKANVDSRLAENEEKAQRWLSTVSQMDKASDLSSVAADADFPEIMPLRKGENRFVVSTRKTPLERRMANSQYQRNLNNDGTRERSNSQTGGANENLDTSISQSLDRILGRTSTMSRTDNKSITAGQNARTENSTPLSRSDSSQYAHPRATNSSYVPFVPLPADMFAKKPQIANIVDSETEGCKSVSSKVIEQTDPVSVSAAQAENNDNEKEHAEKSERWFKRVAALHDVTDLSSAIADENFPKVMPMRKGENRFVVSRKKDQSLTSPMYKTRVSMEQASNPKFVPFVPFPPDYFANKNKLQPEGKDSIIKPTGETSSISTTPEKFPEKSDDARPGASNLSQTQRPENQQTSSGNWNSKPCGDYGAPVVGNLTQSSFRNSPTSPENQNVRSGWTGKSLEGSAVKESNPLDMSEEAKAERWFRRVAQIKDISELSQIPDEDFPSIMPMRKGVNRFVVSKRKTPLERRLTSPQYRRNLPIVSSDPMKKENDTS
ncbi:unnamed protein product [Ilex paraguariensis]|uniref:RanBP2-type domain-containing protein n=1 Tax=Ilex paraguariensis TaxID=185542 RepID=A0ABC8RUJ2_9AQUA